MKKSMIGPMVGALLVGFSSFALADGDAERGKSIFSRCSGCHTAKVFPLAGIFGQQAGTLSGAGYSKALVDSGIVWNEDTLDAFLASPTTVVPGTKMTVAVSNPQDRADIVAHLKTLTQP